MSIPQIKKLPALDNIHIDKFFRNVVQCPQYVNCLEKDKLNSLPVKHMFCIVNSANSTSPPTSDAHWTLLYLNDPLYAIFFDSYGSLPNQNEVNYAMKAIKKYKLFPVYNDTQFQTIGSSACGFFAIFTALCLLSGDSFHDALEFYNSKTIRQNEIFLYDFFHSQKLSNGQSWLEYLTQ